MSYGIIFAFNSYLIFRPYCFILKICLATNIWNNFQLDFETAGFTNQSHLPVFFTSFVFYYIIMRAAFPCFIAASTEILMFTSLVWCDQ